MPSVITPCGGSNAVHGVVLSTVTSQAMANNAYDNFLWAGATETIDTDGFHSAVTNPERFTAPAALAGWYLCTATVQWRSQAGDSRGALWRHSSGTTHGFLYVSPVSAAGGDTWTPTTAVVFMAAAEYVVLQTFQRSGVTCPVDSAAASVMYLGPTAT